MGHQSLLGLIDNLESAITKLKWQPRNTEWVEYYENNNYNRYSFKGKHRISRESMNEKEEQIMKAFDILCFTGNYHMKRGIGLLSYPSAMLYRVSSVVDLVDFIYNMFKERNLFKK